MSHTAFYLFIFCYLTHLLLNAASRAAWFNFSCIALYLVLTSSIAFRIGETKQMTNTFCGKQKLQLLVSLKLLSKKLEFTQLYISQHTQYLELRSCLHIAYQLGRCLGLSNGLQDLHFNLLICVILATIHIENSI